MATTMTRDEVDELLRDGEEAGRKGSEIYETLRPELEKLPHGSYVVIDIATGAFVTGRNAKEATEAFRRRHGLARSFSQRIGQPIRV